MATSLVYQKKTALKTMAMEKGLERYGGFNGRTISRMRKQDFIDFILYEDPDESPPVNDIEYDRPELVNRESDDASPWDEEMSTFLEELFVDDSFQPFIRMIDALYGIELNIDRTRRKEEELEDRIPNEEDEAVPNLTIQDLIVSKTICDIDCTCTMCQKNNNIIEENLKVQTNMRDLEARITCVICKCNIRNIIFTPCNHLATCITCSKNPLLDKKCPLCRKVYVNTTRVFC